MAGFTIAIIAFYVLFRARSVGLNLVKILCSILILQEVIYCSARALLYQGCKLKDSDNKNKNAYFAGYAGLAALSLMLLNLVHWIYAFKLWVLSKKIEFI